MEIGIGSFAVILRDPRSGIELSPAGRLANLLEEVETADRVGIDIFAIGEHHRSEFLDSAPAIILAAAGGEALIKDQEAGVGTRGPGAALQAKTTDPSQKTLKRLRDRWTPPNLAGPAEIPPAIHIVLKHRAAGKVFIGTPAQGPANPLEAGFTQVTQQSPGQAEQLGCSPSLRCVPKRQLPTRRTRTRACQARANARRFHWLSLDTPYDPLQGMREASWLPAPSFRSKLRSRMKTRPAAAAQAHGATSWPGDSANLPLPAAIALLSKTTPHAKTNDRSVSPSEADRVGAFQSK
jgi:hypothetical protein